MHLTNQPDIPVTPFSFDGLESQQNLAQIASNLCRKNIFNLNYLLERPPQTYDYVLCEFGWDSSDIDEGGAPHDLKELDGHQYCDGCSTAASSSYADMFHHWQKMLSADGKLLITGRLKNIGDLLGFLRGANKCGLITSDTDAHWIYWTQDKLSQRAPALLFSQKSPKTEEEIVDIVRKIYARAKK